MTVTSPRAAGLLGYEFVSHLRRGIVGVYLFISLIYIVLLLQLPLKLKAGAALILLFTDTTVLGFFFVGAVMQWEREERIFEGLFVTPLRPVSFICVRVVSLTIISLAAGLVIALVGAGPGRIRLVSLLSGMLLSSVFFTLFGIALAVRTSGVNSYFISATALTAPLFLPLLEVIGLWGHPLLILLPTGAALRLLQRGLSVPAGSWSSAAGIPLAIAAAGILLLWTAAAFILALSWFKRFILERIGEEA